MGLNGEEDVVLWFTRAKLGQDLVVGVAKES